jgi:SSS family solute:Na+ symporter/sodium/pantothenate symporter
LPVWVVGSAAALGLGLHLALNLFGGVSNPAVSASYAIIVSLGYALLMSAFPRLRSGA